MDFSVIITTYNAASTIKLVLESLKLVEDYEFEVIIVDDGSTDNTLDVIEKTETTNLKVIKEGKIGRSNALNIAINVSSGQYLFINDADDVSFPERFSKSIQRLTTGSDLVFGNAIAIEDIYQYKLSEINAFNRQQEKQNSLGYIKVNHLYKTNPLHHSTLAVRKKHLVDIGGYDESLSVCVDLDLYYRALSNGLVLNQIEDIFLARNVGDTRQFSKVNKKNYYKTLLKIRSLYRKRLSPSPALYLYDLKYIMKYYTK